MCECISVSDGSPSTKTIVVSWCLCEASCYSCLQSVIEGLLESTVWYLCDRQLISLNLCFELCKSLALALALVLLLLLLLLLLVVVVVSSSGGGGGSSSSSISSCCCIISSRFISIDNIHIIIMYYVVWCRMYMFEPVLRSSLVGIRTPSGDPVRIGTMQRILAWPLLMHVRIENDTHTSTSVNNHSSVSGHAPARVPDVAPVVHGGWIYVCIYIYTYIHTYIRMCTHKRRPPPAAPARGAAVCRAWPAAPAAERRGAAGNEAGASLPR